jgi:ABC-type transport system substrate-binding protein
VFVASSPVEQVSRYQGDPELESRVFAHTSDAMFAVTMNPAVPPFDDVHVRRAVALSIDKSALVGIVSGPFGWHSGEATTHAAPDAMEGGLLDSFDPYPYDPAQARAEMRISTYDDNGDGRCDAAACRGLEVIVHDLNITPEQARGIAAGLARLGIDVELRPLGDHPFHKTLYDPLTHTPMAIGYGWGKGLPVGADWFSQFLAEAIGSYSPSLLGASPAQLRAWGYSVTSVPSIDERAQLCLSRRGAAYTECWAEVDQYLLTEVVTWLPYMSPLNTQVVSERVVEYSYDQFGTLPALDRIALAPGSG